MLEMVERLKIFKFFPMLIPNNSFTELHGFITSSNKQILVHVKVPHYPSIKNIKLTVPWEVETALKLKNKNSILYDDVKNDTLLDVLLNLQCEISACLESERSTALSRTATLPAVSRYKELIDTIQENKFYDIKFISGDLSTFEITAVDSMEREHSLTVMWNTDNNSSSPQIDAELPLCAIEKLNLRKNMNLLDLFKNFKQIVSLLNDFWNILKEIDNNCLVIDPETKKFSDTHRIIALGHHVTLLIKFSDPFNISVKPELQFFGPKNAVDQISEVYLENIDTWCESSPFLENLKNVLGIDSFPCKAKDIAENQDVPILETAEQLGIECNICYSILLNGRNPTEVCENDSCKACYHSTCLYKWLSFIGQKSNQFCSVLGECPQCGNQMLCSMPDLEI